MDRRLGGVVMVAVALLAATVVPQLTSRVVAGSAVAAPVPGAPDVGVCVLEQPDDDFQVGGAKFVVMQAVTYGPCSSEHYGEVTAVLQNIPLQRADLSKWTDGPGYEVWNTCPRAAGAYLGIPGDGGAMDGWYPTLNSSSSFAGPDRRQKLAGQNWAACIVSSQSDRGTATAYSGSVRDSIKSGRIPDSFGFCARGPVPESSAVPCDELHSFQLLGQSDLDSNRPGSTSLAQCRQLAVDLTRMPDITAGGLLAVVVTQERYDANGGEVGTAGPLQPGETGYATCAIGVVGASRLNGSLLGLGSAPAPLVG